METIIIIWIVFSIPLMRQTINVRSIAKRENKMILVLAEMLCSRCLLLLIICSFYSDWVRSVLKSGSRQTQSPIMTFKKPFCVLWTTVWNKCWIGEKNESVPVVNEIALIPLINIFNHVTWTIFFLSKRSASQAQNSQFCYRYICFDCSMALSFVIWNLYSQCQFGTVFTKQQKTQNKTSQQNCKNVHSSRTEWVSAECRNGQIELRQC